MAPVRCSALLLAVCSSVPSARQNEMKQGWEEFKKIMLRERFTLNDYENILKVRYGANTRHSTGRARCVPPPLSLLTTVFAFLFVD